MSRNRRLLVAALTAMALFSTIILSAGLAAFQGEQDRASSLPRRETLPTTPEPGAPEIAVEVHAETLPERTVLPMILIAIALVIVIIFMIVTAEGRKLLVYTLVIVLLLLFVLLLREQPAGQPQSRPTPALESAETPAAGPPLVFEPPPWLILGVSLGLALLIMGAIALAGLRLSRPKPLPFVPSPLPELAAEARQALADLRAGVNLRDTIIRCYGDMGETLQQHRGLRRSPAMTPEEFARGLASTNLPQADIWRITTLFERVRYGQHKPAAEEESEAIVCLTAIVRACEETS
jgi:hypothetical protein